MSDDDAIVAEDDWEGHWAAFGDAARENPAVDYRSRLIASSLGRIHESSRVLDIGCGEGALIFDLRARYPRIALLGIDVAQEGLDRARALVPTATFVRRDLTAQDDALAGFEAWATHAVCSEVLEHLDQPSQFLRHATRYLLPGCTVVVTVPAGPMSSFDHYIGHRRHFTPELLRAVLAEGGLEVHDVRRAGFPFFNLYRLLVIARGEQMVTDARTKGAAALSGTTRLVLKAFGVVFRANLASSPFGWQLVARARVPGTPIG